jgi:hypothetical protein
MLNCNTWCGSTSNALSIGDSCHKPFRAICLAINELPIITELDLKETDLLPIQHNFNTYSVTLLELTEFIAKDFNKVAGVNTIKINDGEKEDGDVVITLAKLGVYSQTEVDNKFIEVDDELDVLESSLVPWPTNTTNYSQMYHNSNIHMWLDSCQLPDNTPGTGLYFYKVDGNGSVSWAQYVEPSGGIPDISLLQIEKLYGRYRQDSVTVPSWEPIPIPLTQPDTEGNFLLNRTADNLTWFKYDMPNQPAVGKYFFSVTEIDGKDVSVWMQTPIPPDVVGANVYLKYDVPTYRYEWSELRSLTISINSDGAELYQPYGDDNKTIDLKTVTHYQPTGYTTQTPITNMVRMTQAEYESSSFTTDLDTLYIII